jgi:hypothetical protein
MLWLYLHGINGGLLNCTNLKTIYIEDGNWLTVQMNECNPTKLIQFDTRQEADAYLETLADIIRDGLTNVIDLDEI